MKFTDFKHDGKVYKIEISDGGQFTTMLDGDSTSAETFDRLKEKIVRHTRRASVRMALPATYVEGKGRYWSSDEPGKVKLVDIVITGIHQRGGDILARTVGDKQEALRLSNNYHGEILKRLTAAQSEEYLTLRKARDDANRAFTAYEKKYHYGNKEIAAAVAQAEQAAGIEPEHEESRR